jgi:hypothetical protein
VCDVSDTCPDGTKPTKYEYILVSDLLDNASPNNIGTVLEAIIGTPGTPDTQYTKTLDGAAVYATNRILQAVGDERQLCNGLPEYDTSQACKYYGSINYAPYQPCGGSTPVPYCQ